MSEFLRAAREQLRAAVTNIDARLAEILTLKAEEAELIATRDQITALIYGAAGVPADMLSEVRHAVVATTPAAKAVQPPAPFEIGDTRTVVIGAESKTERDERLMLAVIDPTEWTSARDLYRRVPTMTFDTARQALQRIVRSGLVEAEGNTTKRRFRLSRRGRARRGDAAASGVTGKPADDDGPGASVLDISAGPPAGMSDSPQDDNHPAPSRGRPPASEFKNEHFVNSEESLAKGSIVHERETYDGGDDFGGVDDPDAPGYDADLDVDSEPNDLDAAQAALDDEPALRKRPGPKPKYKPGHRQLREHADRDAAAQQHTSWWLRPDADFAAEAERMRLDPKQKKVPGETNIICMNGAW